METAREQEQNEGWGVRGGPEWERLQSLLELVRREHQAQELSPERRDQIRERVLARFDQIDARRRRARVLAGASAMVLAGLVLAFAIRARVG